ncbi:MAG TPA: hypothetical protein VJA46_09190 [Acidimicrobiia bacterium]|nr:hypothetical protein [Acidimicrobiia bacterium]
MGQFSASLKVPGDTSSLPATVDIAGGRLRVASGDHEIGNWALVDIDLTPSAEGVHVSAEGEELILQFSDSAAFEEAAGLNGRKKLAVSLPKPFKMPTLSRAPKHVSPARLATHPESAPPQPIAGKAPAPAKTAAVKETKPPKQPGSIDRALERAENAVGSHLPSWVFTRGGALVVLASLAVAIIFPTLVSTLLMIAGVVLLVLGGVTMLDVVLAARLLKAKVTPTQTLVVGGVLILLGVLFAMLA